MRMNVFYQSLVVGPGDDGIGFVECEKGRCVDRLARDNVSMSVLGIHRITGYPGIEINVSEMGYAYIIVRFHLASWIQ